MDERYFPNFHHSVFTVKNITNNPTLYQCFLKECINPASIMFLYNYWGSVFPIHICNECQEKEFDGQLAISGESSPELKHPFLYTDGTPVTN